jgi:hypothetical protein
VRREGVEPSRPKTLVPGTSAAASYATSAWSGYRESDPGLHHGKVLRCHYAISAWSLLGDSNSDYLRTEEACCRYH